MTTQHLLILSIMANLALLLIVCALYEHVNAQRNTIEFLRSCVENLRGRIRR